MDANAAARNAARQRWMEKDAKFRSDSLKFWNRETSAQRGMDRAATGYSRGISDDYQRALYVQGQGRQAYQQGYIKYLKEKATVNEGGQARRRTTGVRALMRAKGKLEQATRSEFGTQMQRRYRGRLLKLQATQADVRNKLGLTPEYGAPVLMPPSDYLSGALSIASSVASIYSGFTSDVKSKENVEHVGTSPQGYEVYEFNYKGGKTRYRGAMAQDVVKKNPMAVHIQPDGYLAVDYSKIDVNMEII